MKLVTNLLSNIFMTAFSECGYDEALGQVIVSNRLDLCQFQCNGALSGAKQYRKSLLLIAKEVAAHIPENEMIAKPFLLYHQEVVYFNRLLKLFYTPGRTRGI